MKKLLVLSLGLSLLHCSGVKASGTTTIASNAVSTSGGAGSSSASTSGGTSSSGASSGTSSSGQASSSSSSGEALSYHGAVFFAALTLPAPLGTSHTVLAGFVDQNSPIPNDPADCTGGTQVGSCCYRSNAGTATGASSSGGSSGSSGSSSSSSGSTGTSNAAYSAGVITLTDGTTAIGTMTPGANNAYPAFTTSTWNTGDAMTAAGAGATVPSFSGTATAPPAVTVTQPVQGGPLSPAQVSTSSALEVQWDGAGGTEVITVLYTAALTNGASITCVSPDQGHVTVPSSLLANFSTGTYGVLAVARAVTADASVDGGPQVTVYVSTANGIGVQYTQ